MTGNIYISIEEIDIGTRRRLTGSSYGAAYIENDVDRVENHGCCCLHGNAKIRNHTFRWGSNLAQIKCVKGLNSVGAVSSISS